MTVVSAMTRATKRAPKGSVLSLFDNRWSGYALIVLVLVLWEAVSRAIPSVSATVPPISQIFTALWNLTINGTYSAHVFETLRRISAGLAIATVVGLPLGITIGRNKILFRMLGPTLDFLRPAPAVAIVPVAMLFFGLDDRMKIFVIAWGSFWPILLNAIDGARNVDPVLVDTARAYGYQGSKLLLRVIVPAALPYAAAGVRLALTVSLVLGIFVEIFTGGDGLGYMLQNFNENNRLPEMYATIALVSLIGLIAFWSFERLERCSVGWHLRIREEQG